MTNGNPIPILVRIEHTLFEFSILMLVFLSLGYLMHVHIITEID
uniref:Uncharacterized protein n=1 Tax=viral metagenome TaxID=1070528 RepID=A0A6C0C8C2_9ZZZZ